MNVFVFEFNTVILYAIITFAVFSNFFVCVVAYSLLRGRRRVDAFEAGRSRVLGREQGYHGQDCRVHQGEKVVGLPALSDRLSGPFSTTKRQCKKAEQKKNNLVARPFRNSSSAWSKIGVVSWTVLRNDLVGTARETARTNSSSCFWQPCYEMLVFQGMQRRLWNFKIFVSQYAVCCEFFFRAVGAVDAVWIASHPFCCTPAPRQYWHSAVRQCALQNQRCFT